MNIKQVLGNRVLVKQIVEEVKDVEQDGVVVSPTSINPNYFSGTVEALGSAIDEIKVGDTVAYLKYGYEDMGDGQHIVEVQSLLAVVE